MGRIRLWLVAAALFMLGNAMGIGYAIARGEANHAAVHVALTFLGIYFVWMAESDTRRQEPPSLRSGDERFDRLQQSMDAIAVEVERIGEAQRFRDKQQAMREDPPR